MEPERGRKRGPPGPPGEGPPPERAFARQIDCAAAPDAEAAEPRPPPENGRGTGRLRTPLEDH